MADGKQPIDFQTAAQQRGADGDEYEAFDYGRVALDIAAFMLIDFDTNEYDDKVNVSVRRMHGDSPVGDVWEINQWRDTQEPTDGYLRYVGPADGLVTIALNLSASGLFEMPYGWSESEPMNGLEVVTAELLPVHSSALEDANDEVLMLEIHQKA